ncbi:hypothetical protein C5S39_01655, partial [Candidatus Methanophagaceae archaeon]
LEPIPPGTYMEECGDDWFSETNVTTDTSFKLDIYYHNAGSAGSIHYLYLLVAVDRNPEGNVTVNVSGETVWPYNGTITENNKALVNETADNYEYPHGIYKYGSSTHFQVVNITNQIPGDGVLEEGENITVDVDITLDTSTSAVKVHFAAVGADEDNRANAKVPPSHDVMYQVPEFATIAIPVAAILGLLFFFNHRKKRGE